MGDEFQSKLPSKALQDYFQVLDVDSTEAAGIFKLLDADGGGRIDPLEFISGCMRLRGPARAIELSLLMFETKSLAQWMDTAMMEQDRKLTWIGNLKRLVSEAAAPASPFRVSESPPPATT